MLDQIKGGLFLLVFSNDCSNFEMIKKVICELFEKIPKDLFIDDPNKHMI